MVQTANVLSMVLHAKTCYGLYPPRAAQCGRCGTVHCPAVKNLHEMPDDGRIQKAGTYNLLRLVAMNNCGLSLCILVPPSLHIRLGIVNKIFRAVDGVVNFLARKKRIEGHCRGSASPA